MTLGNVLLGSVTLVMESPCDARHGNVSLGNVRYGLVRTGAVTRGNPGQGKGPNGRR